MLYWTLKVVLTPLLAPRLPHRGRRAGAPAPPGPGDPRREPPVVPRLHLLAARDRLAAHDVRREGRVLRAAPDGVVLPRRRPDPDPAQRAGARARPRSTRPPTCSTTAGAFGIYPEGTRTRDGVTPSWPHRRGPARPRHRARRSSRSAWSAPTRPSRRTPSCRGCSGASRSASGRRSAADRYAGRRGHRAAPLTDEVMFEIVQLCGVYEYRDTYATKRAEDLPTPPARLAALPRPPRARGQVAGPAPGPLDARAPLPRGRASTSAASAIGSNAASALHRGPGLDGLVPHADARARRGTPRRARWSPGRRRGCTGTPSRSAWSWHSRSMTLAPPSTRSSATVAARGAGHRVDDVAGLPRHRLDDGRGPGAARVVPRVMPSTVPRRVRVPPR